MYVGTYRSSTQSTTDALKDADLSAPELVEESGRWLKYTLAPPEDEEHPIMASSLTGTRLYVGGGMGSLHTWDTITGDRVSAWDLKQDRRSTDLVHFSVDATLAISPDNNLAVWRDWDQCGALWDLSGTLLRPLRGGMAGHSHSLAISPDGAWVACGCQQGRLSVWNTATGECIADEDFGWDGVQEISTGDLCVEFSADSCKVLFGGELGNGSGDRRVGLWDFRKQGNAIKFCEVPQVVICGIAAEGCIMASWAAYEVKTWDTRSCTPVHVLQSTPPPQGYGIIGGVCFVPGKPWLWVGCATGLLLWDWSVGNILLTVVGITHQGVMSASGCRARKWVAVTDTTTAAIGSMGSIRLLRFPLPRRWHMVYMRALCQSERATGRTADQAPPEIGGTQDLPFCRIVRWLALLGEGDVFRRFVKFLL